MKIFKNSTVKIISIVLLVVSGGMFFMSLPKILTKIVDAIPKEPEIDSNGQTIYKDWRKTIQSFGSRRQFAVEKCGATEISWFLFDRDKNKDIDKIDRYTLSPSKLEVYTIGEKGYTKLNPETAEIIQNKDINIFSNEDIKIFKELEVGKGCIKH